jgi:hypothetical protein
LQAILLDLLLEMRLWLAWRRRRRRRRRRRIG